MLYKANSQAAFGETMVGDVVTAEGVYSPFNGLHEVANLTSLTLVEAGTAPAVTELTVIDAATIESLQCKIVSIELTFVEGTFGAGKNATFKDANGTTITVRGDSKWGTVDAVELVEGTVVKVTGFVNWYNAAQLTNVSGYTFVEVISVPEAPAHECTPCATCGLCTAEDCDKDEKCEGHTTEPGGETETKVLATFELGANGSASHADGDEISSGKSYKDGSYTLTLTSVSKVYDGARDAKGNSCLKFGTSKVTGSMTFAVPENVTSVTIYVAQYKANTTKVDINGTTYTVPTASNNGEYTAYTVDTTTVKTITVTTVSGGVRAMINTIVFAGLEA